MNNLNLIKITEDTYINLKNVNMVKIVRGKIETTEEPVSAQEAQEIIKRENQFSIKVFFNNDEEPLIEIGDYEALKKVIDILDNK